MQCAHIGERLRTYRLDHQIVIKDIAEKFQVSTSTIINWELGKKHPRKSHEESLHQYLHTVGY